MGRKKLNVPGQLSNPKGAVRVSTSNHEVQRRLNTFASQTAARTSNIVEASHRMAVSLSAIQGLLSQHTRQEEAAEPLVRPVMLRQFEHRVNNIAPNVSSVLEQVGSLSLGMQELHGNLQPLQNLDVGTMTRVLRNLEGILGNLEDQILPLRNRVTDIVGHFDRAAAQTAIQSDEDNETQSIEEIPLEGNNAENNPSHVDDLSNKRATP